MEPHHIIAIGASAGGMEEINSFFDHTPMDGVSYVIIQHLSTDFKSRMVELLSMHSKLDVKEAGNQMAIECNKVYLIPNDKFMTIRDNRLYLTDKSKERGPHLTINKFFHSLALNSGNKAIAVILSGLGSDGTDGLKAIKEHGGMVIVRDPETTEFSSMPSNAIGTGSVDFILEPQSMPNVIEEYVKRGDELFSDLEQDGEMLKDLIELIKENTPHDFSDYKHNTLLRRTKRRAANNNFTLLRDYYEFLKNNPDEIRALAKEFLISVTAFFRDQEAFEDIEENIIPAIIKKLAPGDELKMWVAGCATGEEAYSLAILVAEQMGGKDNVVKIFATDIDSIALLHAGKGIYDSGIEKNVSPERLDRFFTKEDGNYQIIQEIRSMVIFAQHDLVKNPPYCNMHLISCRNLLIYMSPALKKKIYLMLLFGLKADGYLFLGPSENPMPITDDLEVVNKKWKIYKNLQTRRIVRFDAFSLPEIKASFKPYQREPAQNPDNSLAEDVANNITAQLDSLCVCVNESYQVTKTFGDTSKYLLQKNFTTNLLELLPRQLAVAFNTLSKKALETGKNAALSGIQVKYGDDVRNVSLSVSTINVRKGDQKYLIVTFSETTGSKASGELVFDKKIYHDQYIINLEKELVELKERLRLAYLQLDASNENLQSFNEELLSANEEMQSSNEEMQSVNEELHTINSDYQLKNKELIELNDDLNNYFRSNVNGQLFVNNDLLLMKFSPGTVKQINLLPTDVGRPLSNISTNIKFETFTEDIKAVIEKGIVITKEIQANDGKWYQIMTMPYIQQADNKSSGAMITFNDITELKITQHDLDEKNKSLQRINEDLDHFVHAASHDLLAPLGNIENSIDIINKIKVEDPKINQFLNVINSSVRKFRTLVKDISGIAKLENGMLEMEMVDMDEVIDNVEWSLEDKIKSTGAIISRELAVKEILFSKKNLRSIVFNLVSNAIKFHGDEVPKINISTIKGIDYVILCVEDNGVGIPEDQMERIFEMYGRINQNIEGHGIGLYLAKKIIHAANGTIAVQSEPNIGSKFTICFKT